MDGLMKKPPGWSDQLYNDVINVPYDFKYCCSCNNHCSIDYCACFRYRMYCDESCPCKDDDCWNQAKNETQIRAKREEIESRIVFPSNLEYDHPKSRIVGTAAASTDQDNNTSASSSVVAAIVGPPDNSIPVETSSDSSTEEDGSSLRKCKCSQHKCLGFLCGCFLARKFCSNDCTCKGCENNRENEVTVLEARKRKDEAD